MWWIFKNYLDYKVGGPMGKIDELIIKRQKKISLLCVYSRSCEDSMRKWLSLNWKKEAHHQTPNPLVPLSGTSKTAAVRNKFLLCKSLSIEYLVTTP